MVNEQGEELDVASDNVFKSETNVTVARENLATSEKWMNSYRKKVVIVIALIVLIVAIIIAAVVGWGCTTGGWDC